MRYASNTLSQRGNSVVRTAAGELPAALEGPSSGPQLRREVILADGLEALSSARQAWEPDVIRLRRKLQPLFAALGRGDEGIFDEQTVAVYSAMLDVLRERSAELSQSRKARALAMDLVQCLIRRHQAIAPFPWKIPSDAAKRACQGDVFPFVIDGR